MRDDAVTGWQGTVAEPEGVGLKGMPMSNHQPVRSETYRRRRVHDGLAHSAFMSLRIPQELLSRLDQWLDGKLALGQKPSTRSAAMREALTYWLDAQARLFESFPSQPLAQQFRNAYESLNADSDWVWIHRLRQVLGWPRERFDAMVEELRDGQQVELESDPEPPLSPRALRQSYHVHGRLYVRLRWRRRV